ncbi:inositol 2-dehydrogenase IolG [Gordonia polyisoprenivorans VH2]|uniref:Inositol 2-dehydrogenase n=1 Tax=Gordonia polyisoprenivorans (strain DSM 44266 / VH2) TaxID=1112204 RepID=H6N036_GORPV|nr:Gfo/Idh/MocA family oxidoreductase [Gordonia polyisoprenivorans]AFA74488.1 inositol 2-dehydrogenase IolG [Gordonia polyisoprenivorans VH2]
MTDLRIAVLGVGMMGADHVARITERIKGATVTVLNDYFPEKAEELAATIPGCRVINDPLDAIADPDVDAVILATPGPTHEKQLLACLEAGKPVMCEKPLTTDVATSLEVVKREAELGRKLIQVGFMRRFDHEYEQLKSLIDDGTFGQLLVAHCVHRNPMVPPGFDSAMIVKDSIVHEVDVTRFLFDEEIVSVQIIAPGSNPQAPEGLKDPQIAIFRTASGRHIDVECFVTTGVAYEVRTEVVGEFGSAFIGLDQGGVVRKQRNPVQSSAGERKVAGIWGGDITPSFVERFGAAYDAEIQRWVNAVKAGINVDGPGAWDGYAAAAVCAAGVKALETGEIVTVDMVDRASIAGA